MRKAAADAICCGCLLLVLSGVVDFSVAAAVVAAASSSDPPRSCKYRWCCIVAMYFWARGGEMDWTGERKATDVAKQPKSKDILIREWEIIMVLLLNFW